jgi:1-aminocyclopropane-1-carboxylate deaminase
LLQAKAENQSALLTFGGAYSNHIAAVAFAGKENGFQTIGIVRGDELAEKIESNPTLKFAQECGMQFEFVSRETYRLKTEATFLEQLQQHYGAFYLIPEGGTNALAIQGCQEISIPEDASFDFVACAIGTGGTISGLINSVLPHQKVLGFPALNGEFLQDEIRNFVSNDNWELITDYHFGGYGKVTNELIDWINQFYAQTQIPLDPVYTGKMVFGILDLIAKDYFPENANILMIHTGGLQGIQGMNLKLLLKSCTLLDIEDYKKL